MDTTTSILPEDPTFLLIIGFFIFHCCASVWISFDGILLERFQAFVSGIWKRVWKSLWKTRRGDNDDRKDEDESLDVAGDGTTEEERHRLSTTARISDPFLTTVYLAFLVGILILGLSSIVTITKDDDNHVEWAGFGLALPSLIVIWSSILARAILWLEKENEQGSNNNNNLGHYRQQEDDRNESNRPSILAVITFALVLWTAYNIYRGFSLGHSWPWPFLQGLMVPSLAIIDAMNDAIQRARQKQEKRLKEEQQKEETRVMLENAETTIRQGSPVVTRNNPLPLEEQQQQEEQEEQRGGRHDGTIQTPRNMDNDSAVPSPSSHSPRAASILTMQQLVVVRQTQGRLDHGERYSTTRRRNLHALLKTGKLVNPIKGKGDFKTISNKGATSTVGASSAPRKRAPGREPLKSMQLA